MKTNAEKWKKNGDVLFKSKKYDRALRSYEKAAQIDPKAVLPWLYNEKGDLLSKNGNYKVAIKFYERATELDRNDAFSWYNLAMAYHNLQEYGTAIEYYNAAIKLKPDYSWFWINKASAYDGLEKFNDALRYIDEAIDIDPNNATAWAKKGSILFDMKKYRESIKLFQQALEINPKDADVMSFLGSAHYHLDQIEEAMRYYKYGIDKIDKKHTWLWNNLGYCYHIKGDHSHAIRCFNRAIKYKESNYTAWFNKAGCLQDLDKFREAEKCFNESIKWYKEIVPSLSFNDKLCISEMMIITRRFREARKFLSTLDIDQTKNAVLKCIFMFLPTASYLIQSASVKRDSAKCKQSLERFLEYCRNLEEDFVISQKNWNFEPLINLIRKRVKNPQSRFILLCLIDLLSGKIDRESLSFFETKKQLNLRS